MPRWARILLVIGIVFALALLVTIFAGIEHGPGLHAPPGDGHDPTSHGP